MVEKFCFTFQNKIKFQSRYTQTLVLADFYMLKSHLQNQNLFSRGVYAINQATTPNSANFARIGESKGSNEWKKGGFNS